MRSSVDCRCGERENSDKLHFRNGNEQIIQVSDVSVKSTARDAGFTNNIFNCRLIESVTDKAAARGLNKNSARALFDGSGAIKHRADCNAGRRVAATQSYKT